MALAYNQVKGKKRKLNSLCFNSVALVLNSLMHFAVCQIWPYQAAGERDHDHLYHNCGPLHYCGKILILLPNENRFISRSYFFVIYISFLSFF